MNAKDKYLCQIKVDWIRDNEQLSDADFDILLGEVTNHPTTGEKAATDPARNNPNPLSASGLVDLLSAIIDRKNRQLTMLVGLFDLDGNNVAKTVEAINDSGKVDPVVAIIEAVEMELARRGPVARKLTRWLLDNVHSFVVIAESNGWDKARLADELVAHLRTNNEAYASAVEGYFGEDDADRVELCLLACCVLLGLDYETVAERAGIYEFDADMTRAGATIKAAVDAIREKLPALGEMTARCFFELSAQAIENEQAHGWSRTETSQWIYDRMNGVPADVPLRRPTAKRRAG